MDEKLVARLVAIIGAELTGRPEPRPVFRIVGKDYVPEPAANEERDPAGPAQGGGMKRSSRP